MLLLAWSFGVCPACRAGQTWADDQQMSYQALQSGRYESAVALADRGLRRDRNNVACLRYRIFALLRLGRLEASASELKRLWTLTTPNAFDWSCLGDNYAALNFGKEARLCYEKAISLDPDILLPRLGLINSLEASGAVDQAISECRNSEEELSRDADKKYLQRVYSSLVHKKAVQTATSGQVIAIPKTVDFRQIF